MPNDDVLRAEWRKSSRSSTQEGACVEIADLADTVAVRDSKDPHGPVLLFDRGDVRQLADRIRGGHLDP